MRNEYYIIVRVLKSKIVACRSNFRPIVQNSSTFVCSDSVSQPEDMVKFVMPAYLTFLIESLVRKITRKRDALFVACGRQ